MILIIDHLASLPATPYKVNQEGASMIVCVCNNISDREIRQAVDLGLSTMAELRQDLGVATCCGKCASCAKQVLVQHLESKTHVVELSFRSTQAA
jgi:bacterioferritin-associated ferredoxin